MTASSLAPDWLAPFERVGVPAVLAAGEEAVILSGPERDFFPLVSLPVGTEVMGPASNTSFLLAHCNC
jgi:hypothetical protein